ncbi:PTS lactose transporter subunit IIC [Rhodobacteraceae bacterium W635]|uniref:PTS sugar transporter subunit IIA n=1 Tax=Nioella halotolerans TaxID=2303578 RepID=UPI000E3CFE25|nr:PTS lactose transporter subunit IIC [Rhodobacteraceae bacterium W635]
MELSKLLQPQAVRIIGDVSSKKRLLQAVADIAAPLLGQPETEISSALLDRESLGPTGFGQGVALPHARLSGLSEVTGVFLKLERPVDFNAVDRQPVDLVFALFAPETAGTEHLKALALVSRTLRNTGLCEKLRANSDPATLHAILTEARASQAA